jgi:hypothetical protein
VKPSGVIVSTSDDETMLAAGPTYRIDQSFERNAGHGPHFDGPHRDVPVTPTKHFFGLKVKSRFGLAAGAGMGKIARPTALPASSSD